jgi:hypothetical protein
MTSTDIVDSSYSPTQSIVTFLTQTGATDLTASQRVFDFEISSQAQTAYSALANALLTYSPTTAGSPEAYATTISDIYWVLDQWSQMKNVTGGVQESNNSKTFTIPPDDTALRTLLANTFGSQTYSDTHPATSLRGISVYNASTGVLTLDSTMTRYMGEQLDTLVRTMRAAGWDPVYKPYPNTDPAQNSAICAAAINAIFSSHSGGTYVRETTYGIDGIIRKAIDSAAAAPLTSDASTQSQSLQQLLMVDYVVRGNELLYGEMNNLNSAINLNQTALSYLNSLQDLLNQKDPQQFLMQLQYLQNLDATSYSTFEQQTFGNQSLGTTPKFTDANMQQYILNLRMQALGVSLTSTDPVLRALATAQYGTSDNFSNLMAVMDYNISRGLISYSNGTITIANGGLNPTTTAVQNQYCLKPSDVQRYQNAIIPALRDWYNGSASMPPNAWPIIPPSGYPGNINVPEALQAWFDNHKVQGNYGITSFTDTMLNMVLDGTLVWGNTGQGTGWVASTETLSQYGLYGDALGAFLNLCPTQAGAISSNRQAFSQAYVNILADALRDNFPNPLTSASQISQALASVHDPEMTPDRSLFTTIGPTFYQIYQDGKDYTDPTIQAQYGLFLVNTSGAVTSTGTAADAFIDSATDTFNVSLAQIKKNLDSLINKIKATSGADGSALGTQLKVILDDFTKVTTVAEWVKDYDTIGNEGNYQRHMNDAITASQAFNDTERENLRRVMFVYEEFYKSATAMLDKLNTIIEKMGSAIKG